MSRLMNVRNQIIDGLLQSRINPIIQKYNQPKQTGLLNFVDLFQCYYLFVRLVLFRCCHAERTRSCYDERC